MRKRDFYGLPRSLQDRFIESSQGVSVPKPLLVAAEKDWRSTKWGVAAALTVLIWAGYTSMGFGDLSSPLALGGVPQLIGHILLGALATFFALRSFSDSWEASHRPYGTGASLYPSGVIRAVGSQLHEYDASEVTLRAEGTRVIAQLGGKTIRFPAASPDQAEAAVSAFEEGKKQWLSLPPEEELERARLHPLTESGVPNPLAPTDPYQRPRLLPFPLLVLITLVVAGTVGYAVHSYRTKLSERALYQAATEQNTVESLEAYLARGGHRPEVANLLLPRAELAEARSKGTVEAILEFQKGHPDSQIAGEIQAALRDALLADLEAAKKKGTLTAIDAFKERHEHSHLVTGEIAHARREIITRTLESFKEAINPESRKELMPFLRRLLAYSEQYGPRVMLRIRQEFTQDRKKLDKIVMKSRRYYLGRKQLPTQYFLGEPAREREKELLTALRDRFQKAAPPDVLKFEIAPLPEEANVELPPIEVPTLTIEHRERLSGGFVGGEPRGVYLGAAVYINSSFELPEGAPEGEPLTHKLTQWRPPRFAPPGDEEKTVAEVYEDMMTGAFEKYRDRYLEFWFRQP